MAATLPGRRVHESVCCNLPVGCATTMLTKTVAVRAGSGSSGLPGRDGAARWQRVFWKCLWLVACFLGGLSAPLALAQVNYVYDAAGRLVVVYAPSGDAAQYVYDAAGNIAQINRFAATGLSIIQFTPESGAVGTAVTIYGTGFSATPASNIVAFNGTDAVVTAATTTKLVVTVPTNASSGPITVTRSGNTATSTRTFTVGNDQTGTITVDGPPVVLVLPVGRSARYTFSGTAGQYLGLGYNAVSTVPSGKAIAYTIYKPDGSQLFAVTSLGNNSDNIPVLPVTGTYTLLVRPVVTSAANVTLTLSADLSGTLTVGGATTMFSTARVGQNGRYTFNATAGQNLSLWLSNQTFLATVRVYKPDGSQLTSASLSSGSSALPLTNLPTTGTYEPPRVSWRLVGVSQAGIACSVI